MRAQIGAMRAGQRAACGHVAGAGLDQTGGDAARVGIIRRPLAGGVMEVTASAPNISYFAFTATPKAKTLELFGRVPEGAGRVAALFRQLQDEIRQALPELHERRAFLREALSGRLFLYGRKGL